MLKKIIALSIAQRHLVILASIILLLLGVYSIRHIAIDALPDLSDVQVIVKTSYAGQAPQVVEDQVTYPLATAMLSVPGSETVRGYSFFGDSYVYILFKEGTDPYWARSRVLEYLNQAEGQLPQGVKPQLGPDASGVGWVYQYALVDRSGHLNLAELTSLQNWFLKFELQSVPGVSEVATVGGMVKQYQVKLDPNKLRTYGVTIGQIKQAIVQGNNEASGSVIEMAEAEYMVRATGYIDSVQALKDIPISRPENGTPILLSDIADISVGPQSRRGVADLNGQGEVVGGIVVMRQGENALTTIAATKEKITRLSKGFPEGVEVVDVYDRSGLIERAIDTLTNKLVEEFLIVVAVCLLFLFHFRSSLIILFSLPIGILCSFIIMYWQGINANIMSLGGIAIAVGAMVDATVVMIENVHKHFERQAVTNENRWKIILQASQEVGPALFFSLLIITVSFLPIFSLQGQEGKLFSPLAFTKTYSMAAAALLSITLVPVLMGYFIRGKIVREHKNPINRLLMSCYKPFIASVLKAPKIIIVICILLVVVTLWPLGKLGSEFLPQMDEGDWMYMPTTLPGISIGKARQLLQQTDKLIMTVPEVMQVFGKVGRADTATDPAPITMIETVVQFKPKSQWAKGVTSETIKKQLNGLIKFPGLTNAWVMPIRTRIDMLSTGIKTPVGIKISGPSLKEIQAIGTKLETILTLLKGSESVYADRAVGGRYINVDIDRKAASRFGLSISQVQEVVSSAIGGMNVAYSVEGLERYPINVRYPQSMRDSLSDLQMLPIVTQAGLQIPLSAVAKISIDNGPPAIKSENARPTGWVLVDINGDVGTYVKRAQKIVDEKLSLSAGYSLHWTGQYEYMQRAKQQLMLVVPVTLGIIILLLFLYFRNLFDVFVIMLTLPLASVGSVWLLWLLDYQLSVAVAVGFIALSGVSVEIGVVMLMYLKQAYKERCFLAEKEQREFNHGDLVAAVIDGALKRIRPIVMTVAAVVAGLLPIMLSSATGSEIMKRIAAPMVGGMISAMVLTLLVIPAAFYLSKKRKCL
jgi:copper/silver efflux system protein